MDLRLMWIIGKIGFKFAQLQLLPEKNCLGMFRKIMRNTSAIEFHEKYFLIS